MLGGGVRMDAMDLRRMVMAQMAAGAQFVKGSFTVPNDALAYYTLDFGKSFSRYLFLVEMDNASKTMLSNSGISANRIYAEQGIFPMPSINDVIPTPMYIFERIPSLSHMLPKLPGFLD